MNTRILAAALMLFAAPALAFQCPLDVKKIDNALAAGSSLGAGKREQVTALRDEGNELHQRGQHGKAVKTLAKAKAMLGI